MMHISNKMASMTSWRDERNETSYLNSHSHLSHLISIPTYLYSTSLSPLQQKLFTKTVCDLW